MTLPEMVPWNITIRHGNGDLAREYHDQICLLYDSVFSAPPFIWTNTASADHARDVGKLCDNPTFASTVALTAETVIGFAYGHRLPVDHGWWKDFSRPLPIELTREWEGRTFALINFAVSPRWRGKGVGKRLLSRLLSQRTEDRAVLSVQPSATQTQQIYDHLGWQRVGRKGPIPKAVTPYWDIFLLPKINRT